MKLSEFADVSKLSADNLKYAEEGWAAANQGKKQDDCPYFYNEAAFLLDEESAKADMWYQGFAAKVKHGFQDYSI